MVTNPRQTQRVRFTHPKNRRCQLCLPRSVQIRCSSSLGWPLQGPKQRFGARKGHQSAASIEQPSTRAAFRRSSAPSPARSPSGKKCQHPLVRRKCTAGQKEGPPAASAGARNVQAPTRSFLDNEPSTVAFKPAKILAGECLTATLSTRLLGATSPPCITTIIHQR